MNEDGSVMRRGSDLRKLVVYALFASALAVPAIVGADSRVRATMWTVFEGVQTLLEISARPEGFYDPANRERILTASRDIEREGHALGLHVRGDPGAEVLGGVMSRQASKIGRLFEHGRIAQARSLTHGLTALCIACHTRLPSPGDSPVAAQFIASDTVQALPPVERATMQIATRRFAEGLDTLSSVLRSPRLPADRIEPLLTRYLLVSIRVAGEFDDPIAVLEHLGERTDLDVALQDAIPAWIRSLRTVRRDGAAGQELEVAVALIGDSASTFVDRHKLIDYIVASGLLRPLASSRARGPRLARAYYLLGFTEDRIAGPYWLVQAEAFLERAILTDPGSVTARRAYDLLARRIYEAFTGPDGIGVPDDVAEWLTRLNGLASGA